MSGPSTNRLIDTLRSGVFLTRARIRLWALAVLVATAGGLIFIIVTADGMLDRQGRPLGTDFSNVYAAGTYVLDGHAEAPFDPERQHARERAIFGTETPFYGWHYPPFFLGVAAVLALMPYGLALLAWQGTTLVAYLVAIRAILLIPSPQGEGGRERMRATGWGIASPTSPSGSSLRSEPPSPSGEGISDPLWLLLAIAFPAVFVNLGHGHNGFLTAALLAGGLVLIDRRPLVAGLLFGLLAYKPQFGVMIPLVLVATGRWRTFAAAALTVAALALATTLAFGPQAWDAFLASTRFTRVVVLEAGDTGWHKIQTVFALVRMWGGTIALAYAAQGAVTMMLAVALVWLWRSRAAFALKAAALSIAVIVATPYSLDYDMMALAPAIAFLAADGMKRGFAPYQKTALAVLWIVPLFARTVAEATLIPIGVLTMLAVFGLVLHRSKSELGDASWWLSAPRPIK